MCDFYALPEVKAAKVVASLSVLGAIPQKSWAFCLSVHLQTDSSCHQRDSSRDSSRWCHDESV